MVVKLSASEPMTTCSMTPSEKMTMTEAGQAHIIMEEAGSLAEIAMIHTGSEMNTKASNMFFTKQLPRFVQK